MDMILKLAPARARTNAEMYHLSFKTKLFLEEEAGILKQFDQFNRNNVRIECCGNNIFRFKVHVSIKLPYLFINFTNTLYSLTQDQILTKAIDVDSKLIKQFSLECAQENEKCDVIMGQRIRHFDNTHFYIQLSAEKNIVECMKRECSLKTYNIRFHENRSTFQSQHLALDYMQEHKLVDCLVNNKMFGENVNEHPMMIETYCFR